MFNKMFGVSPPPVGQALDAKVDLKKDLQDASPKEYKNDFEKTLKEKLAAKDKSKDKLSDASPPKEMKVKKDDKEPEVTKGKGKERDSDEDDSSGGTKKRMNTKVDDQMISMLMASNENEVEIPESKNDLATIEESQPTVQNKSAVISAGVTAFALQPQAEAAAALSTQAAIPAFSELNALNEAVVPAEAGLQTQALPAEVMQKLQALQQQSVGQQAMMMPSAESASAASMQVANVSAQEIGPQQKIASELQQIRSSYDPSLVTPKKSEDTEEPDTQPIIAPEQPMMDAAAPAVEKSSSQMMSEILPKAQVATAETPVVQAQVASAAVAQAEVAAPVAAAVVAAPVLASTLKSSGGSATESVPNFEKDFHDEVGFEPEVTSTKTEEKPVSLKAQQFEKSVYEQLQKMDQRPSAAAMQSHVEKHTSQDTAKSEVKTEDGASKSLKMDAVNPNELHHVGQTQSEFKAQLAAPAFPGSEQHRAQLLEKNHDENIQKVMNQAEYLVKQGGGEMKVSMSPDGLSDVQLKVMLQDGKVNIEMRTHDKNVKKLMEDSLTELKSGLAAHNLSVEHVKINTVPATNTDNSAQFQSNWNQGGSEQQQREYWNQFQDNLNQNQKQNFARRSNYGSESRGADSSSISAMGASAASDRATATPRTYGGTKGSQINWVA